MKKEFSIRNKRRCEALTGFNHNLCDWSISDWMIAILGELGEAANIVKKLNRVRDGIIGNKETPKELRENLKEEIADTYIYLDLFCQAQGIDLEQAVESKFNKISEKIRYTEIGYGEWRLGEKL